MFYGTNTTSKQAFGNNGVTIPVTSLINYGGYFSNNTFTVPYSCYIKVSCTATLETSSTGPLSVAVYRNNTEQYQMFYVQNGFGYQTGSGMHFMYCAAGDALTIKSKLAASFFYKL